MKEKLLNNLGIKILSICLATFLWIVIVNIEDPVKVRSFTNIPVQILNESTLTSKNKAFDIISGDTVDFSVSGKRSQIEKLKKTDFIATADLSQLTAPFDTVKINVECTKTQDIDIVMGKVSTVRISLEDIVKERFSIKVDPVGTCAPGYAFGKAEVSPVMIDVSGAESIIEKIYDIRVSVDINGANKDITRAVVPKAYNRNGVEILADKLKFSYNEVTAKITILNTKVIPVVIETVGKAALGYEYAGAAFEPQEIEVKGESDKLKAINELPIPLNISGLKKDEEYTISVHDLLLGYGVSVVDPELENLVVKVTIEKLVERTFSIAESDIQFENLEDGLGTEFVNPNRVYSIKLAGLEGKIDKLNVEDLNPVLDLGNLSAGRYRLELKLNLPTGITQVSAVIIPIKVVLGADERPVISQKPPKNEMEDKPIVAPDIEPSAMPSQTPAEPSETPVEEEDKEKE
ncbi:CdaR family protein [[Clostridium] polysaccharolyticum]|uniref:YbbR domain-containing protein n=1 Tax=[Clostridium] polysaccharolyticum TaxID=29364 RepID=A0A1H9ZE78_9FIRM|nr:CdaR family protein [[Clostridium] polysaccharolyticum]SES79376.1 YbbR domain-containing protein [[Clostridium] polysaccharolyticum]